MTSAREYTVPDLAEMLLIKSYFTPLLLKISKEHSLYCATEFQHVTIVFWILP